jgi:subtilisin family serine protease
MTKKFIVAPGGDALTCESDVFSTYLRSAESFCSDEPGYEAIAGTSMATPFVSGVAALLASEGLSNDAIVQCLLISSDDLGLPGWDPLYGHGRLNALEAVSNC